MQFKKNLITQNNDLISLMFYYYSDGSDKGQFKIEIYRQHQIIGSCQFKDVVFDPFKHDEEGKIIPKEAEILFEQFKNICGL